MPVRRTAKQKAASRRNGAKRKKRYRGKYSNKKSVNRAFHAVSIASAATMGYMYFKSPAGGAAKRRRRTGIKMDSPRKRRKMGVTW